MQLSRALLEAAIEATALACKLDRPADSALSDFFRQHRALGSHDRRFIADSVFSVLRHKRLLETIVPQPNSRRLVLASLLKFQDVVPSTLEPLISQSDRSWLRETLRAGTEALPPAVRLSLPDWLWQRLEAQFGADRALRLGTALLAPAPLDVRVNTMITTRGNVIDALTRQLMRLPG